ncbi:MmcQ/YjbR family DNA-binding protein [Brevibacillus sp. AY1]|uniref:MmcQ/YjbR family DNA-binding protein n=1 Tax=Brevibacillus sp. AY1 TaxID=2807621 RepID=UPI0024537743|nr:MmcQ/YjbR family DNA-binding protein [Brevibacillus sp. AY1]MDH4618469.1 MmcQ/YjbR family DNA-binding protein [Brevibacillus sp. AY1]
MNLVQIRTYCLNQREATEDFPFGDDIHVYKVGGKMFALLHEKNGTLQLSLKSEPELAEILRLQYTAVIPGYHLNKRHWNTVMMDGSIPDNEVFGFIDLSYRLVFKSLKKSDRERIGSSEPPVHH